MYNIYYDYVKTTYKQKIKMRSCMLYFFIDRFFDI